MIKQLAVLWIFATLLSMTAFANPNKSQDQRTISLEFRDPRRSFEANTAMWQTLNQSIAHGLDQIGTSTCLEKSVWSRAVLFSAGLWTNTMLRFYSHELAHEYVYRNNHVHVHNALDFRHWKSSYIPGFYYPGWKQSQLDPNVLNDKELISATVTGLNQDEQNARAAWGISLDRESISFYDAQSFLLSKFRDVEYIAKSGSDEAPFAPGQQIHELQYDIYAKTPHLFDDVNLYRLALLNDGVNISTKQLMNRALFADVLSWHTWESVWSLLSYLLAGPHSAKPFAFKVGDNVHILPPLFSHYMTLSGSFFNSSCRIGLNDFQVQLDIGSIIGFTKIEAFQRYRIGAKALNIKITSAWLTQPYIFTNGRSGLHLDGVSVGLDNIISISHQLAFLARAEYNQNDLLENVVKCEQNGFQAVFGMRAIF